MYQHFYQLTENPFNVTADPDFFFPSKCHDEAITSLLYGIEQRKGMLLITGEIGTGKTTLCRQLVKRANENTKFALILNPKFSEVQLLQMIVQDLGIESAQKHRFGLINALNEYLIREATRGNNVVLIVDEAQNLSVSQLEQIRLLSNLETEKDKLLQILLVGQPELYSKLQLPSLRQLSQRIAVYYSLQPLAHDDIKHYIRHRLTKACVAPQQEINFTDQAIQSIYQYTGGSPRTINILCDRALIAGFVAETFVIDKPIIDTCAKEVMYFEHHL